MFKGPLFAICLLFIIPSIPTVGPTDGHTDREIEGWTIHIDNLLLEKDPQLARTSIALLEGGLHDIRLMLPADKVERLQEVEFWLDFDRPGLQGMQYHPNLDWLEKHGHDPALHRCVHIPQASAMVHLRKTNYQPWVLMHELAHAYHHQVLGFGNSKIRTAFENAKKSGNYEKVMHIKGGLRRHYALTDHKEYFAEGTEAYLGTNDFFPFVRPELKTHDPELYRILEDTWGKR